MFRYQAIQFTIFLVLMIRGSSFTSIMRPNTQASLMVRQFWPFDKAEAVTGIAIIDAIQTQNEESVKSALAFGGNKIINDRDPSSGNNAMHIIAKRGHYKFPPANIPKLLIVSGIDVNAKNVNGETPLEISLLSGWQVT